MVCFAAVTAQGCMVPEPGDLKTWMQLCDELPVEDQLDLKAAARRSKNVENLQHEDGRLIAVSAYCRMRSVGGEWSSWNSVYHSGITFAELQDCLNEGHAYADCLDIAKEFVRQWIAGNPLPPGTGLEQECEPRVEPEAEPDIVNDGTHEDLARVTWREVYDAFMHAPKMPPGIDPRVWEVLAPVLCAGSLNMASAAWACSPTAQPLPLPGGAGTSGGDR